MRSGLILKSVGVCILALISVAGPAHSEEVTASPPSAEQGNSFKQTIRVWVHKGDMRPKVLRGWPGKVVIVVENQAGTDISLHIDRLQPNGAHQVAVIDVAAQSSRWKKEVTLPIGDYEVYEVSHRDAKGRLIVEPRN